MAQIAVSLPRAQSLCTEDGANSAGRVKASVIAASRSLRGDFDISHALASFRKVERYWCIATVLTILEMRLVSRNGCLYPLLADCPTQ